MLSALVVLLCLQESSPSPLQEPPRTASASLLDPLQGNLRVKYRYRATSTDSDSDLYEIVTLNYGNPEKDALTATLIARFAEDLDGNQRVRGYYPFTSLDDHYSPSTTERLYTAYVDYRPAGAPFALRAGRQTLEEFPEAVIMDGASLRVQASSQVALAAFGGIPDNLFESSPEGDAMYGAWAEWVPDLERRGRYRVGYLHIRDENVFGLHRDDLVGFSVDEGSGPLNLYARYTLLEGKGRDFVARLTGAVPDAEFLFQFQGTYVFHRIEALSYALDPYASFLMDLQPYLDLALSASKGFGAIFFLDASFTARQFVRDGVETTYNHEFKRVQLAPSLRSWPFEEISWRILADYWNSSADNFWTLSGDITLALHRDVLLSVGSSYALYSIDKFTGEEHERVRLYTLGLTWKVSKKSSIDVRFSVEDNSIDRFRTLDIGFLHAF